MISIVKGDILKAEENISCHQVNCFIMGSGLAYQIMKKWPTVQIQHKALCDSAAAKGEREKLLGSAQIVPVEQGKFVANLFAQFYFGRDFKQYTSYDALKSALGIVLREVSHDTPIKGASIAIPYGIGCGLGGGDWFEVLDIIEEVFKNHDVTLYNNK
jgi:O-acetyl-ADP-ribose deacetylase (regulator of RNase III)